MKKYGHIISKLRKNANLTQEQLGKKLNVTYQAVSKWENNLSEPDLETIEKITQIFGITVAEFFDMSKTEQVVTHTKPPVPKPKFKFLDFVAKKPWWLVAGLGVMIFILSLCAFFVPVKQSSAKIFQSISKSTFCVNTLSSNNYCYEATGFFINSSGLAVTTYEVIDGAVSGNIELGGQTYPIKTVVGVNEELDLALIQIDIKHSKPVKLGNSGTNLANKVYTVGINIDYELVLNESIISKVSHSSNQKYWQLLTTSAQDGSALVNQYGQVVGILTSSFGGDAGMDTAIPISLVNKINRNINLSLREYYDNTKTFSFYSNGSVIARQEFLSGHLITPISEPTRTGYAFAGWYTSETFETQFDFLSPVTTQIACYAKWTPNTYIIRFNANGGVGQMADITATYDVDLDLPVCAFAVENNAFAGWTQIGNNTVLTDEQTIKNLSSTNGAVVELTALWEKNKYTIVFDGNTADSGTMENLTLEYDQTANLPLNQFTKTGYLFNGWTYNGQIYEDQQEIVTLSKAEESITLSAQWKPITYYVDFCYGSGETQGITQTFVYDQPAKLNKCTLPAPEGDYVNWFDYWYRLDVWEQCYQDEQEVLNLATTQNERVVLVAVWQPAYFIINFNYNGGSGDLESVKAKYDSSVCIETLFELENVNNPTRTGYSFGYWECEGEKYYHYSSYTFPFEQSNIIIEKEFKAIWSPNSYTVKFYSCYNDFLYNSKNSYEQYFKYDQPQQLDEIKFEKTGMVLDHWKHVEKKAYYGVVEYGDQYYDQEEVLNLTTAGTTWMYATWKGVSFNVEFHNIDNQGGSKTLRYTYTDSYGEDSSLNAIYCDSKLKGYNFLGYNFNGKFYARGESIYFVKDLAAEQGETYKLYAVWEEEQTCEIQFYANGGEGEMQTIEVYPSEPYYLPKCLFVREGYEFLFWSVDRECDVNNPNYQDFNRYETGVNLTKLGYIVSNKTIVLWANWEKV